MAGLTAEAQTVINAPAQEIWSALTSREALREFMFGADVVSDWQEGNPVLWEGEWNGTRYRDHGEVLESRPAELLSYTHFSPLAGKPDRPENYHTISIRLDAVGGGTRVTLTQDNNETEGERQHSATNWETMLAGLKEYVEDRLRSA